MEAAIEFILSELITPLLIENTWLAYTFIVHFPSGFYAGFLVHVTISELNEIWMICSKRIPTIAEEGC